MTSTAEILKAARKLIEKPENWTQGEYARRSDGVGVLTCEEEATCFCVLGAIARVQGINTQAYILTRSMADAFGVVTESEVANFNDSHTHSEVLDLFSKAISSAEEKQGEAS